VPLLQPLIPSFGPLGSLPAIFAQIPPSLGSHSADRVSDMSEAVGFQFVQDEAAVGVHAAMVAAAGGAVVQSSGAHRIQSILSVNRESLAVIDPSLTVGFA